MLSITQIAFYQILGLPLVAYGGIITASSMFFTASIPLFRRWKIWNISLEWHFRMAYVTIALATIHGLLALLANLGF